MDPNADKNSKRVLAVGVLFAAVGLVALAITMMQPAVHDERAREASEIFSMEEKAQILENVRTSATPPPPASSAEAATDTSASGEVPAPADVPDGEKMRILESLSQ